MESFVRKNLTMKGMKYLFIVQKMLMTNLRRLYYFPSPLKMEQGKYALNIQAHNNIT